MSSQLAGESQCKACAQSGAAASSGAAADEPVAVLLRPQAEYGSRLLERLWFGHGVRALSVSAGWRDRLVLEPAFPALRSEAVAASYVLGRRDPQAALEQLGQRHRVVAVLPHHEQALLPLAKAAQRWGLGWAQPEVLPLFRDKAALKDAVRRRAPRVRLNRSAVATSPLDVLDLADGWGCDRLVLKPNDGSGSADIAFLDRPFPASAIASYFWRAGGEVLVEEFIGGEEFFVDGQMDHRGEPLVLSVRRYRKVAVNGRENVSLGARSVRTYEPVFADLARYAEDVMRATGLRRSPFHMEVKVDDRGPCLIEVAARLVGQHGAILDSVTSGVDVFDLAVHYYLHGTAYPGPRPDWQRNDSVSASHVTGVSFSDARIDRLAGVAEVEAMPEFLGWSVPPRLGARVHPTVDVGTLPWSLLLRAGSDAELARAEAVARGLIRWNDDAPGPDRRLPARAAALAMIWVRKLWRTRPRWWLLRTRRLPRGRGPRAIDGVSPQG